MLVAAPTDLAIASRSMTLVRRFAARQHAAPYVDPLGSGLHRGRWMDHKRDRGRQQGVSSRGVRK
jgi:hypothetical protein